MGFEQGTLLTGHMGQPLYIEIIKRVKQCKGKDTLENSVLTDKMDRFVYFVACYRIR